MHVARHQLTKQKGANNVPPPRGGTLSDPGIGPRYPELSPGDTHDETTEDFRNLEFPGTKLCSECTRTPFLACAQRLKNRGLAL